MSVLIYTVEIIVLFYWHTTQKVLGTVHITQNIFTKCQQLLIIIIIILISSFFFLLSVFFFCASSSRRSNSLTGFSASSFYVTYLTFQSFSKTQIGLCTFPFKTFIDFKLQTFQVIETLIHFIFKKRESLKQDKVYDRGLPIEAYLS